MHLWQPIVELTGEMLFLDLLKAGAFPPSSSKIFA